MHQILVHTISCILKKLKTHININIVGDFNTQFSLKESHLDKIINRETSELNGNYV